ncbi:MAG: hypothetical protein HRF40_14710 [Nitrososphaera sp.]|jgi:hypothetical protein
MVGPDGIEEWQHPLRVEATMIIFKDYRPGFFEQNGIAVQDSLSSNLAQNNNLAIGRCEDQDHALVTINGMEALQGISECTLERGFYFKTKTYTIISQQMSVTMAFTATSSQSYINYEPAFDQSAATAKNPKFGELQGCNDRRHESHQ